MQILYVFKLDIYFVNILKGSKPFGKKSYILQGTVAIISSVHIASRHIVATLVNSALKFFKLIFNWGLVKGIVYLEKHLY